MRLILRFDGFQFTRRQRMKRCTAILKSGSVRPPVRETLASRVLDGKHRTFAILNAET
jgi:hypothetical protein